MSKKIDIITLYLDNYVKSLLGREIARKISVNHQTALNHLNDLVKENIIKYEQKGRNKHYTLRLDNQKTTILLEIAEHNSSLVQLDKKVISTLISQLLPHSDSIILFGSFAKNKEKDDSDIDMIIVGRSNEKAINRIKERYPKKISIEYVSYRDFQISLKKKKALALEILKAHTIFGNLSKIVDIYLKWYRR